MYAEHDPRIQLMGEDLGLEKHHKMKMQVWDLNFADGRAILGRTDPLFKKVENFVSLVYLSR